MNNREALLTETFVELADGLVDDFDIVDLMVLLAERCIRLTEASAAGILLLDRHDGLRLIAATSDAIETIELLQVQNDEGPCRDCCRTSTAVIADDLSQFTDQWPHFVPSCLSAGYLGVHAFPLRLRGSTLGALGLFRSTRTGLSTQDTALAQALADVATIALLSSQTVANAVAINSQLQQALDSRVIIEQAKGVLAQQTGLAMDEVFLRIRTYARSTRRPLTDVARDVALGNLTADQLHARPNQ